MMWIKCNIV